jgi:hypothetical protein
MAEKILELNTEKNIFWTLVGILFFCAIFYMYSINVTIRNVVARENLENKVADLTLAIGNEEFQYINLRNTVTLPLAYSLGFKDVKEKTYISKKTVGFVSQSTNKI